MNLKIFDETLRDGEQQAGLFMPLNVKNKLAKMILETGIHYIDIMPVIHESEKELIAHLAGSVHKEKIIPATILRKEEIDVLNNWDLKKLILFAACSDRLIRIRDKEYATALKEGGKEESTLMRECRQRNMNNIIEKVKYAYTEQKMEVFFALEDATRADTGYLKELITELSRYTKCILLCDTVGILTPSESYRLVSDIIKIAPSCDIGVHYHNDMGLALENTLQAIEAGANVISGTFRGIGERAGNVALEQVLNGLKERYCITVPGIDYDAVNRLCQYIDFLGYKAAYPYSGESKRHESGIHVNALLCDRQAYSIFPQQEPEIWFGKFSGSSNFKYLFETILNQRLPEDEYDRLRDLIKHKSYEEQRSFSTAEMIAMLQSGEISLQQMRKEVLTKVK